MDKPINLPKDRAGILLDNCHVAENSLPARLDVEGCHWESACEIAYERVSETTLTVDLTVDLALVQGTRRLGLLQYMVMMDVVDDGAGLAPGEGESLVAAAYTTTLVEAFHHFPLEDAERVPPLAVPRQAEAAAIWASAKEIPAS